MIIVITVRGLDGFFRWRPIHVVNIILRHFDTFKKCSYFAVFLGLVQMFESQVVCECRRVFRLVWPIKQQRIPTGWILLCLFVFCLLRRGVFLSVAVAEKRAGMAGVEANVSRLFLSFFFELGVCMSACVCVQSSKKTKQMRNIVAGAGYLFA